MRGSQAEVDQLRAEGIALGLRGPCVLQNTAELVGCMVAELRSAGFDEDQVLHDIELVLRASDTDRESLREARRTLKYLGYAPSLLKMLTQVARKAKPRERYARGRRPSPPDTLPNVRFGNTGPSETELAVELLRPWVPPSRR